MATDLAIAVMFHENCHAFDQQGDSLMEQCAEVEAYCKQKDFWDDVTGGSPDYGPGGAKECFGQAVTLTLCALKIDAAMGCLNEQL